MLSLPEKSTCYLSVSFKDKDGALQIPTTVTWEALDLRTHTQVKAPTTLTPASSLEIVVGVAVNTLLNEDLPSEIRRVIVRATYGVDDGVTGSYDYVIRNLRNE